MDKTYSHTFRRDMWMHLKNKTECVIDGENDFLLFCLETEFNFDQTDLRNFTLTDTALMDENNFTIV